LIAATFKAQRISCFGHVQKLSDTRTVKKIFNYKPLTKRSKGSPKYRWEDYNTQDICKMKIKNWIVCVQDRRKWTEFFERAKISTRKFSAWKKEKKEMREEKKKKKNKNKKNKNKKKNKKKKKWKKKKKNEK